MFDWLFEGRISVYVLLGVAAALLLYAGRQRRQKSLVLAGCIVACLIGLYYLLDRFVETDREQVRRKLAEMADGVRARDAGAIFQHISERFDTWRMDRAAFRRWVEDQLPTVEELRVSNITFPGGGNPADGTLRVTFDARVTSGRLPTGAGSVFVDATFRRDADGQWRLTAFQASSPLLNNGLPLERPPGF